MGGGMVNCWGMGFSMRAKARGLGHETLRRSGEGWRTKTRSFTFSFFVISPPPSMAHSRAEPRINGEMLPKYEGKRVTLLCEVSEHVHGGMTVKAAVREEEEGEEERGKPPPRATPCHRSSRCRASPLSRDACAG